MPTYEYVCSSCANEWEEVHKISEPAVEECPKCHNKTARRQISGGRFILKGGGWYADLYSSSPEAKPGGDGKTEGAPDAKTPDAAAAPAAAGAGKSEGGGTGGSASPAASPTASPSTSTGTSGGTTSGGGSSGGGKGSGSST